MLRSVRCPRCGRTYWQGRSHQCQTGTTRRTPPWRSSSGLTTDDVVTGCCLYMLFDMLWDGCLVIGCLWPVLAIAILWLIPRHH